MDIILIKQLTNPIFEKFGVSRASLFGSVVRGDEKQSSDIDIIIDPAKGTTLFDMAGMKIDLEKSLKKPVDLLTYRSIHPRIKKYILKDQRLLYEKK